MYIFWIYNRVPLFYNLWLGIMSKGRKVQQVLVLVRQTHKFDFVFHCVIRVQTKYH